MGYFVTGATGFIGRNLVELLLEREGTIYVLVREGSKGRLQELRNRWGVDEDRIVGIVGDLSEPRLGVSDEDLARLEGEVDHLFHLAAIYDMTANAETQRVANVEGTRHMVELRRRRQRRDACTWSARSPPPASTRAPGARTCSTRPRTSTTTPTSRPSTSPRASSATSATRPWRVYRPGIVVGNSETGEMDKVDGPYYFFKLIRRIRNAVPQWLPMPGVEGREINIVPVDFVVKAMDHIAHIEGLDGRAFHLTDPNPHTAGEVIDIFARAAHAPQSSVRVPPVAIEALEPLLKAGPDRRRRSRTPSSTGCSPTSGSRARSSSTSTTRPTSTRARPRRRSRAPEISVPPLEAYAGKLWDYWERHLDPDLFRDRTLMGAARGRLGLVGGLAQIIEQQIPDELLRLRPQRVVGNALARGRGARPRW